MSSSWGDSTRALPLPPREVDGRWRPVLLELRLQQTVLGVAFVAVAIVYWVVGSRDSPGLGSGVIQGVISLIFAAWCWRHFGGQRQEAMGIITNGVETVATVEKVHRRPKGGHDLEITFEFEGRTIQSKAIQKTELIEQAGDERRIRILADPARPEKVVLIPKPV